MATHIHARKRNDKFVFRLWNTERDNYLTDELTEEELRMVLLYWAVDNAFEDHDPTSPTSMFTTSLALARKTGAAVKRGYKPEVNQSGPWEEEMTHMDLGPDYAERRKSVASDARNSLRDLLQKLLAELPKD